MERIAKAMIVYFAKRMPVDANGKPPGQVQKQPNYERSWLSEQTDDKLFDLYMENVGFFDMNGTMLERENMIETLAAIDTELAKL